MEALRPDLESAPLTGHHPVLNWARRCIYAVVAPTTCCDSFIGSTRCSDQILPRSHDFVRPAFAHKVMAVALTEWLVETRERLVEKLISFFIGGSLFTPRGWFSYHISSQFAANWNSALHSGCNFKSKEFESGDLLLVLYIFVFLL